MKVLSVILTTLLLFTSAHAQYGGGKGEPNDPYLIYTAEHLNTIGLHEQDWGKNFKLMAFIRLYRAQSITSDELEVIGP